MQTEQQIQNIAKAIISFTDSYTQNRQGNQYEQINRQRLKVRYISRWCFYYIQVYGDAQDQSELVNVEYGRVTSIAFSTAGGIGEEQDKDIDVGLKRIWWFLRELNEGRNNDWKPSFQPLPILAQRSIEQIEEEGANEEIDVQMNSNGLDCRIKYRANEAKTATLNLFIHDF
ncbi:MAG: hypothetical protein EZS28_017050 [Streblomastix strix]|uniref:Uncharacterized protein n=1 Tax=Streblomastix strix TaxID=222440 RepID=A0A5J4VY22_9EUKA|nr:MAG: hypothetical protein EZS28_017050 [Streblomastix strix]